MVVYQSAMRLSVPAVGLGLTARPPGSRESTPQPVGSTVIENKEDSSFTEESLLKGLLEAPATNDRCADDDMRDFYVYFLERME